MKLDPQKKPFRCKYIFGVRHISSAKPAMIRPNPEAMPNGMTMETMDRIIRARSKNSRMNEIAHTPGANEKPLK